MIMNKNFPDAAECCSKFHHKILCIRLVVVCGGWIPVRDE